MVAMKELFLSQNLADKNSDIMNMFFQNNKKLDNIMDFIGVTLVMDKLSSIIHKIAHMFPLDADAFRDYNAGFSYRTIYSNIMGETKDYNNLLECIEDELNYLAEIDNAFMEAYKLGKEEQNVDYTKFITNQINNFRKYKNQFILFYDKVEKYIMQGNTLQDIDARSQDFFIIGD